MDNSTLKMIDNKRIFIKHLQDALRSDPRSEDVELEYRAIIVDSESEYIDEHINIQFDGGGHKTMLTTGNSNLANMKAIANALLQ